MKKHRKKRFYITTLKVIMVVKKNSSSQGTAVVGCLKVCVCKITSLPSLPSLETNCYWVYMSIDWQDLSSNLVSTPSCEKRVIKENENDLVAQL